MTTKLNQEQKKAAEAPRGPLLIVAGAGTGKTRTLTSRIIHFIEKGLPPEKICAITFTNKAAQEMCERISNLKSQISNLKSPFIGFIGTLHSLGAKLLRNEAHLLGRNRNFTIFDDDDSFSLVKKIAKKFTREKDRRENLRKDKFGPVFFAKKISEIKNLSNDTGKCAELDKDLKKAFLEYENELRKNNAFDFDDLIEKPVALFQKYPKLLKKYQNKFSAVLVDEYQDLNPKQYEFIRFLAGGHKNLSVVGDDEQMIYGWRHADIKIFLNFENDWPDAKIAFLEENYRSTGNIIRAAQSVAENNIHRRPKNLWTKKPDGALIKIIETASEEQEAEWIAEQIFNFQFSVFKDKQKDDEHEAETTAVLYRTNAQSRAIEQALIRRQIPYKIFGGMRFYERKEIKDVIAALRFAFNPKDAVSRERLEKNLTKTAFRNLEERLLKLHAMTMANDDNHSHSHSHGHGNPAALIKLFLEKTDYFDYLDKNFINADERRENIAELINFASKYEDLGRFLEEVALMQPLDDVHNADGAARDNADDGNNHPQNPYKKLINPHYAPVNLMTIHLSKGLEFDRVFIAGACEGLLPHAMSMENDYRLEEERRLMYVAMTRAKKELNISFYDLPSRFIGEIPEELIEYINFASFENENRTFGPELENYISLED